MAKISAKPVLFKAPVSIGTDEYTSHLSQCEAVPTQPTGGFTDLDGITTPLGGKSTWVLNLAGAQDYETLNGLSMFLLEHEGEEITVTYPFGGQDWTVTAIAAAVTVGGVINTPALFSTALQCGAPVPEPIV